MNIARATNQTPGFALPTVMIASVVMLILLLASLVAVSSINVSLRNQYYDKLAQEAAESGINLITGCIKANQTPLPGTGPFTPASTSCTNKVALGGKSLYVLDSQNYKTTFSVDAPVVANGYYTFKSVGEVKLFRTSGTEWRSIKKTLSLRIQYQSLFASRSSSGIAFVCGLINRQSYCWGRNTEGQLGDGTWNTSQPYAQDSNGNPILVKSIRQADNASSHLLDHDWDIAAGKGFTCAITLDAAETLSSRKVVCWGMPQQGELGRAGIVNTSIYPVPTRSDKPWEDTYNQYPDQILASNDFACTLTIRQAGDTTGNIYCWGNNNRGQLGRGTTGGVYPSPQKVVTTNGNTVGLAATYITTNSAAKHVCGYRSDYKAFCWGFNEYGQVGNGTEGTGADQYKPIPSIVITVGTNDDLLVSDIAVGGSNGEEDTGSPGTGHSCAVGKVSTGVVEGKIYCWGMNTFGQIGETDTSRGFSKARMMPWLVNSSNTNYVASKVAASNRSVCAVAKLTPTSPSGVYCWGSNIYGELGIGSTSPTLSITPVEVPFFTGKNVSFITGGGFRFCAIVEQSNYCWGRDYTGQVGDGHVDTAELTPTRSKFLEPEYTGITY